MKFTPPPGATPINPGDLAELIPSLQTQDELNEFEQTNIALAEQWAAKSRALRKDFPSIDSLKLLHNKMFDKTWKWAGEFRRSDTNLGTDWRQISPEVKKLCDDVRFWIEHKSYGWDELAARFHHRLVFIHPFKNGNGRHSRLATDVLLVKHRQQPFSWGSQSMTKRSNVRGAYIASLIEADKGNIKELIEFAKS